MPAGILSLMREVFSMRPSPAHSLHGFSTIWPMPRQRGQVWETWKKPREEMTWPRPPQVGQAGGAGAGLGAAAGAAPAGVELGDLDFLLAAGGGFLEANLEVVPQVAAAVPRLAGTAAGGAAEELLEDAARASRRAAEDLAEEIEGIVETSGAGAGIALGEGGVAEAVVRGALLVVHEDVVGFAQLLEALLGVRIARVFVRVKLHRETAVRFLDLLGRGGPGDLKNFVIIAFGRGHGAAEVNQEKCIGVRSARKSGDVE